jgi:hypothetical protein
MTVPSTKDTAHPPANSGPKMVLTLYPRTAKRHQEELFRKLLWEELQQLKTQIEAEEACSQRLENGAENSHRARRIREYVLALSSAGESRRKNLVRIPPSADGREFRVSLSRHLLLCLRVVFWFAFAPSAAGHRTPLPDTNSLAAGKQYLPKA